MKPLHFQTLFTADSDLLLQINDFAWLYRIYIHFLFLSQNERPAARRFLKSYLPWRNPFLNCASNSNKFKIYLMDR